MKTSLLIFGTLFSCFTLLYSQPSQPPIEIMSDITNDFGVCVLQLLASPQSNAVVSPYGLVSVALLLYEGSNGVSAAEFHNTLHLPWHRDITRLGFRDLHNYLKSYFTSDGFLRGLILNKSNITLLPEYIRILQFYGFQPDAPFTQPPVNTTMSSTTSMTATNETTTASTITRNATQGMTTVAPTTNATSQSITTSTTTTTTTTLTTPTVTTETTTTTPLPTTTSTQPSTTTPQPTTTSQPTTTTQTPLTTTPQSTITTTNQPAASTTPQSTITTTNQPAASTTPQSTITTTNQPAASTTPQSTIITTDQPAASTTPRTTITTNQPATTQTMISESTTSQTDTSPTRQLKEMVSENKTPQMLTTISFSSDVETMSSTSELITENMLITTQEVTTTPPTSINKEVTETVDSNATETKIPVLSDNTVPSSITDSNESLFKPSSRIISFTSSDVQSTQYYSPPSTIRDFQPTDDISTLTDSNELLTTPFVPSAITVTSSNLDDIMLVSTPADSEMVPLRDMSILDALMLGLNSETILDRLSTLSVNDLSSFETTEENVLNKRSTIDSGFDFELTQNSEVTLDETNNFKPVTTKLSEENYQSDIESNSTESNTSTSLENDIDELTTKESFSALSDSINTSISPNVSDIESPFTYEILIPLDNNSSANHSSTEDIVTSTGMLIDKENSSFTHSPVNSSTLDQDTINTILEQYETVSPASNQPTSTKDKTADLSLLTILSDSITFHNKSRHKRSIYGYQRNIQFGNWITPNRRAPWFQNAGEQWFSTYSGKKLVPMLTYTAYLPFVYISSLGASALELPLDDVRYSLLILLPNQNQGLRDMLNSLTHCPLRYIVTHLKHTPVYAVVPIFTIVKHINLTPVLQTLGIKKVFDAFQANLTNMSNEPNLYVRSVEQVITVSIRKYYNTSKWINAAPSQIERHFIATRPFAFFVIDSLSKVSLLAGTIVDPLYRSS